MLDNIKADLCVIGAGSGGLSVAAGAVQLGLSVVLIEKGEMGGDCLNSGCVPSKALLAMGKKGASFQDAHRHVRDVIATIAPHDSQERFEGLGCTVLRSHARFIDPHTIETEGGEQITARYIVIATGSSPVIPPIEGLDERKILTNQTIFQLKDKPDHLIIIGGGPIGVEMAQLHVHLGCKVSLIEMGTILPKDDPDLVDVVRTSLRKDKINLYEHHTVESIVHGADSHQIIINNIKGETQAITGSHVLVATGRKPSLAGLGLEGAGVIFSDKGIAVDKRLRTNQKHIFAIGDASGGPQFTHVAGYHAGIVIKNICFRIPAKIDYRALPWVTYTSPELAQVGLTEAMAAEQYGPHKIRTEVVEMKENDRALVEGKTTGKIKIVGLKNGKILGVGIISEAAGEHTPVWSLAIQKGMKFSDLASLIIPYPTIAEISKRAAGQWYTSALFSEKTRKIIRWIQKIPLI